MKYCFNHWFKPDDFETLVERLTNHGHYEYAEALSRRYSQSGGQLMRLDPKEAYSLSQKAQMPFKTVRLPADLKTVSVMIKAAKASSLQEAFETLARAKFPDLNLLKDNGGSYMYREAAERFEFFVAGTFC